MVNINYSTYISLLHDMHFNTNINKKRVTSRSIYQ